MTPDIMAPISSTWISPGSFQNGSSKPSENREVHMGEKAWPGWAGGWNAYESLQRTKLDFPACIPLRLSGTLPSNGPGMGEKWGGGPGRAGRVGGMPCFFPQSWHRDGAHPPATQGGPGRLQLTIAPPASCRSTPETPRAWRRLSLGI